MVLSQGHHLRSSYHRCDIWDAMRRTPLHVAAENGQHEVSLSNLMLSPRATAIVASTC